MVQVEIGRGERERNNVSPETIELEVLALTLCDYRNHPALLFRACSSRVEMLNAGHPKRSTALPW